MKHTILFLSLFVISTSFFAQNIEWRGDRTGVYNEKGLLNMWPADGPEMLWSFNQLGEGHSSVAISSDKIYLTGMTDSKGFLYVLDMQGKLLDKKEYGEEWDKSYNGPRGTLTINDEKIYLISGTGNLICFDQKNLDIIWKKNIFNEFGSENIKWGINESPLIINDKVIATPGGDKYSIVALDKNTGKLIWGSPGNGDLSAYCSPVYISDQEFPLVITMVAKHIIGVNGDTGEKVWQYENKNRHSVHSNTPLYDKGMLLCTSGYGKGSTMLKLTDGGRNVEKVWESSELDNRIGAMVKVGDYAYGSGDSNRYWFCVNWQTGEITFKDKGLAMGVTIADDGLLYCYTDKGEMALVKAQPDKFEIISQYPITLGTEQHWSHPVIYKGVLYVRHGNTLMAYDIKQKN